MKIFGPLFLLATGIVATAATSFQPQNSNDYEVIKETFYYVSDNRTVNTTFSSDIYFSQSYFEHSAYEYDPHLATTSLCLALSSYADYPPYNDEWYLTQSKNIKATLETLGFNSL